jgi:isoleucyl-tRNA synthetase
VHFLHYPEPREELFDEVIERRVSRLQNIIELGRVSREREPQVNLKQPLRTLVVLHPDPVYLGDIKLLEDYIEDELSVHILILSSDESKYNVKYGVQADWTTLGRNSRKMQKSCQMPCQS